MESHTADGGRRPGRGERLRAAAAEVLRDTQQAVRRSDLWLSSAGATLYGALAAVPSLLVAVALVQIPLGRSRVQRYGLMIAENMPDALGAEEWTAALFRAGLSLSPVAVGFAVVMGSAYGDGWSRALLRLAPQDRQDRSPAWWNRATTLPMLGLAPLLLALLLLVTPAVSSLRGAGAAGLVGSSYLALNAVWIVTWLPLTWTYRIVGPGRPAWRAALAGGVITGAFVSGFFQGFLLFLALPVDLGRPFGGLGVVGGVAALLIWLWVLHAVVCVGYALTWALDARLRGGLPSDGAAARSQETEGGSPATTGSS